MAVTLRVLEVQHSSWRNEVPIL